MNVFHWTSLGVTGAMVAGLLGSAALIPVSETMGVARASFEGDAYAPEKTQVPPDSHNRAATRRAATGGLSVFAVAKGPMAEVLGYDLNAVIRGQGEVPRVRLVSLPRDLDRIRETARRKSVFFKTVLPLVLQVN